MLAPSAARSGAHVPSPKAPDAGAAHTIPDGLVAVSIKLRANGPAGPNSHGAVTNLEWCQREAARIGAQPRRVARVVRHGKECAVYAGWEA